MATLIYIVEDDTALRQELMRLLKLQGYDVAFCKDFRQAAQEALELSSGCVVLDLTLPDTSGHEICRDIREHSQMPIIMLTSSTAEFDEVMALGLGANDYVTKPYRPAVLLARIQAALRESQSAGEGRILSHRGVSLDPNRAIVGTAAKSADLTRNEMRILGLLMARAGQIVSRQDIMCELWESDAFIDDNTLTVNVNRLRKALESIDAPPDFIRTHRGIGYSV